MLVVNREKSQCMGIQIEQRSRDTYINTRRTRTRKYYYFYIEVLFEAIGSMSRFDFLCWFDIR